MSFLGNIFSFPNLEYKFWQRSLLIFTSSLLFISAVICYFKHFFIMGIIGMISGTCSINYWYKPGVSWRQYLDITFAFISMVYYIFMVIIFVNKQLLLYYILYFVLYILCTKLSWYFANNDNESWAYCHACGHLVVVFMALTLLNELY